MKNRVWIVALLWPLTTLGAPAALLELADPAGDDFGDGRLVYPRDSAFQSGDLDLRTLRVHAQGESLRFEASFANPVRNPATVQGRGMGSEALSVFARRGFYAFNLDVYVRTGERSGAGHAATLPGRGAVFAAGQAWDRVVVLTPRPELMRRQLREALTDALPAAAAQADAAMDTAVHFATDVRVSGRTVAFTVPRAFFGSGDLADWSITALVTQAKLAIEADISIPGFAGRGVEGPSLGAQAPRPGQPEDAMGYGGDREPATAVVDLLNPDPQSQARALATGGLLTGLGRGGAPAQAVATVPATEADWFARALLALARGPALAAAAPAPAPVPVPATAPARAAIPSAGVPATAALPQRPPAVERAPAPPVVVAPSVAPAAPTAPARSRDAAFYEEQEQRLLTLKRLRDKGLITEAEYEAKRREVLDKL